MMQQRLLATPGAVGNGKGFTLVELVAVILLLGIVGVFAIGRFNSPDVFAELAARDALLAGIRQAQQASLGRENVSFRIDSMASEWRFIVEAGAQQLAETRVPQQGVQLQTGSAAALPPLSTDSCASGSQYDAAVQGFELAFDGRGNIATFRYTGITPDPQKNDTSFDFNGVRICLNDTLASSICVSPAGYAYEGNCDP